MSWIVKKGDRVQVPHVEGRVDVATVVEVTGASGPPTRLEVRVHVEGCSNTEFFFFDELKLIEKDSEDLLTLNQLTDFEAAALRMTLPLELAQHFEGVVDAARRDIMRRLAGDTRREYERQESSEQGERDRLAALVTIILRDAVVLAGGDDAMAALDHVGVRVLFADTAAALVQSAELAISDAVQIATVPHEDLIDIIGPALISAGAVKVIDGARALIH